jgi:hypothetical protein
MTQGGVAVVFVRAGGAFRLRLPMVATQITAFNPDNIRQRGNRAMANLSLHNKSLSRTAILRRRFVLLLTLAGFLAVLSAASTAQGATDPYDGDLHFTFTPYLWLPTTSGRVTFNPPPGASGSPSFSFNISPIELLRKLDFGLMGAGEVRKGDWSVFTDLIFLKLSGEKVVVKTITGPGGIVEIPVDAGTQLGLKGFIWTLAPSYTVYRTSAVSFDVFAGFRDAQFKPSLEWRFSGPLDIFPQTGTVANTIAIWDGLIGAKGRVALSADGKWFAPYYADVGIGAKAFTWQGILGVGYAFEWGDLHLDYRALYYSPEKNSILNHLIMHGPSLTANFRF